FGDCVRNLVRLICSPFSSSVPKFPFAPLFVSKCHPSKVTAPFVSRSRFRNARSSRITDCDDPVGDSVSVPSRLFSSRDDSDVEGSELAHPARAATAQPIAKTER